jgi:hypothetical protein
MSLYLPRGPFFLGELLPVTVSLSNHSAKAVGYLGSPTANACVPLSRLISPAGRRPCTRYLPCSVPTVRRRCHASSAPDRPWPSRSSCRSPPAVA